MSDLLPSEPGGYSGFQALFGHKYVAPQLGAGKPDVTHDGYEVTNAAGNLVDLNGNQINGDFLSTPGFPGFGPINAAQSLAYAADMLESGVPVVNAYMADLHGNNVSEPGGLQGRAGRARQRLRLLHRPGAVLQPGVRRLLQAARGRRHHAGQHAVRAVSADEGDHEAGANVGRAVKPTPAGCDGATVSGDTVTPDVLCTYPSGSFGELAGNLTGLLATQKNDTTPFTLEADTAPEFYLTGNPGPTRPAVRRSSMTWPG